MTYIVVSARTLDAADYGVPQNRVREFLVGGPVAVEWPKPTHYGPKAEGQCAGRVPWRSMGDGASSIRAPHGVMHPLGLGRAASEPWRLDLPAPTVTTTEEKGTRASAASSYDFNGGPDRASDAAFLATGRRRLTWQECATLQDFPADHPFQGPVTSRYRQVGNAVPPTMARVVAEAVIQADMWRRERDL